MKRFMLIAAVGFGMPVLAQESNGYVRGFIGTPILGSAGLQAPAGPAGQNTGIICEQTPALCASDRLNGSLIAPGSVKKFSGIDFGAALGWRLNSSVRAEVAIDFRNINLDIPAAVNGTPPTGVANFFPNRSEPLAPVGDGRIWTLMANGIYDVLFDPGQIVDPYVGIGAGWASARVNAYNTAIVGSTTPSNGINGTSASGFAFNVLAGLSYDFSDGLSGTLEYKYTNMLASDIDGLDGANSVKYRVSHSDHLITVGVSYDFGAGGPTRAPPPPAPLPPPRPVAPPAPPVANCSDQDQSVVVYFGLNKTSLTPEDIQSISNAVRAARNNSCSILSVSVVGYTDRSGNAAYNKKLSERRGGAVRDIIVAEGVRESIVEVTGTGELDTARPAPDGKVDALSRRAEIYIRAN